MSTPLNEDQRELPRSEPELIVVLEPENARRLAQAAPESRDVSGPALSSVAGALSDVLRAHGAALAPLFPQAFADSGRAPSGPAEDSPEGNAGGSPGTSGTGNEEELHTFFRVEAPSGELESIAEELRGSDGVAGAYVRPAILLPTIQATSAPLNTMVSRTEEPAATTPDFTPRQGYLDPAPAGVDARFAWTIAGGRGARLRIVDCEHGWLLDHEDLLLNNGGVVSGTNNASNDHGTAVFGIIGGDRDAKGITGISADAWLAASSWTSQAAATAITEAAEELRPGDFLLLEGQLGGPNHTNPGSDVGLIALEWWPDLFAAIRAASNRGIIVIEAAGNGFQNLDDAVYNTPQSGFPSTWRNPFNTANPQCGAVMVGAGAPPTGFNGSAWGPDRSRLDYSNYGSRVDAQGWGREVVSAGYGDLQGGDPKRRYTAGFSGTSSASPIVLGALAAVQGIATGRGPLRLTPARARSLLRMVGTPQQAAPSRPVTQRIGRRPDAKHLLTAMKRVSARAGDFDGDGRAEVLVTSPWGIGILKQHGSTFSNPVIASNGTRFGGWLLNTEDNLIGPVADFDGDGRAEVLVTSPWGIGILKQQGNTFSNPVIASNGTRFGGWLLNTADNHIAAVGDFDGDGRAEVLVTSPWGIGILKQQGNTFENPVLAPNGTRFGGWLLNTADNHIAAVGDFDGDGRAEVLVTSPWGVGILKQQGNTFSNPVLAANGTRFGQWLLNTADNQLGPVADFDGDGRAEVLVTSPWGIGILKQQGNTFSNPVIAANGTRFGQWLLNTADNQFGPVADLDGDGRAEILVTSPWGIGILEQAGTTLGNPVIKPNGTRFGQWLLNTADNRPGALADLDGDGRAEILVTSPWGIGILEQAGNTLGNPVIKPNGTRFGQWLLNTADNEFGV
ncbi:VCBS repeat protein [Arthrobacter sp. SLBN-100]|uniref:FG-GAP-like repeat-containing protein n=1 Tax=Arthrobacter sp. SLBN-100 TaxID=2768450 RepID=UPI0011500E75|nr:FG-GAP-like repeat-containing protein [Arthrobacter sp. SLBN-100]TQJ67749.1 VCBS repeat protein [Arthrobacter sp. SLBN-100]